MTEITEWRSCAFTNDQGYNTHVETLSGDGRYDRYTVVCLGLGETRLGSFSESAFSIMTPKQARELAEELVDAAKEAEVKNA